VALTVVGTAITLVPTILHVRAPMTRTLPGVPWLMLGGLTLFATGAALDSSWLRVVGMLSYVGGLATFGVYLRHVLRTARRRKIPTAGLHLIAALLWLGLTALALVVSSIAGDNAAMRDFVVVGGAAGFAFQAVLGAWAFLLPSARAPAPERRRRELVAMELGGRVQVVAYNIGVMAVLIGLRSELDSELMGTVLAWAAATWALLKSWLFPLLAMTSTVHSKSALWWAAPGEKKP
jgi:nitrite reductase (NO-forming)